MLPRMLRSIEWSGQGGVCWVYQEGLSNLEAWGPMRLGPDSLARGALDYAPHRGEEGLCVRVRFGVRVRWVYLPFCFGLCFP